MSVEQNKENSRLVIERGFNQGDLSVVDELLARDGVDHQEPPGTDYCAHLKQVIIGLRTAFPDLHFEIHEIIGEGDSVAFRSTMTGTHLGPLRLGPGPEVPPTGRKVSVPHLHFVHLVDGKGTDLWHQWDTPSMLRQLGVMPGAQPQPQHAGV